MNDIIYIRDLRIDTLIGLFEWERRIKQTLRLDLELSTDIRQVAFTGDLEQGVDYKAISKRVSDFVSNCEFELVETLAERVAQLVLTEFNVAKLKLRLGKPGALRGARDVGVIIERSISDYPATAVYIGLGSNLQPREHLPPAIDLLRTHFGLLRLSSVYESDPVGFEGPRFLNLVAQFDSQLIPEAIAGKLKLIEKQVAGEASQHFENRKIDVDFLLYGDYINAGMKLPRKDILEYPFVLKSMLDLAPQAIHPQTQQSYAAHWLDCDNGDLVETTL